MIAAIVLIPLLAAIAGIAVYRNMRAAKKIAVAGSAIAMLLAALVTYGTTQFPWFAAGGHTFNISISVTPLNLLLLAMVLVIGLLVMVYSMGYMENVLEQRRYYIEMLSFEAAMVTFAISGNFIVLFIAWEFLSLTSYLLIGFWHGRQSAIRAARKAISIIFIGDLALLGSMAIFLNLFGTLEFAQIISGMGSAMPAELYAGILLLLVAVFTKSAQFPFHEWLIDAMEGPTPVSAYLHSSTMVKAGVFTVILLYPLFSSAQVSGIIFAFGVLTLVLSTLAASREMHIKKVIAYSTIQELSIMLVAVSGGAVLAAIYFFLIQGFYKALLFFSSGVVMDATGNEYLDKVSGLGARKIVFTATLFGVLSLAGFVPFSGFFANEAIGHSFSGATYLLLSGISLLTSFYIVRWFSYAARDRAKGAVEDAYIAMPGSMVYPIAALALLTLVASVFFFSFEGFITYGGYLNYLPIATGLALSSSDSIYFTALIAVGAAAGYLIYYRRATKHSAGWIGRIMHTGPIVNGAYSVIAAVTGAFAGSVAEFDSWLNDRFDDIGRAVFRSGYIIRRVTFGSINSYAMAFAIGLVLLFVSFYYLVVV